MLTYLIFSREPHGFILDPAFNSAASSAFTLPMASHEALWGTQLLVRSFEGKRFVQV